MSYLLNSLLFTDRNVAIYFDPNGIEYTPKKNIKQEINQLFTIYLEYKIMNLLCVDFVVSLS